ncbi:adenylate/guanylate cyclase domain-containing protein [Limnoglobus roseus]|uniref:Adenylate/guanylate cyclase domain-containing protein n=1 Tax=Limnoglobus roseus TaxID=2598579 RepID=A0A5C1AR29_9BACT|nr:adenylate/guanylate cyclase domain-containing protein [Limnoglobus roseus]QEL21075.1 adenylate/guanylate cyclase domain-containing protein [Limnoglobus roseus]
MPDQPAEEQGHLTQLRLLLEELCCELCRFEHATRDHRHAQRVRIDREYYLGIPGAFADIRVAPVESAPYLIEVKFGYSADKLVRHLKRKFSAATPALANATKVVLVVDAAGHENWPEVEAAIIASLAPGLTLEVWSEDRLIQLLRDRFLIEISAITPDNLIEVRQAIDRAQGYFAFGGESQAAYEHEPLNAELLWHFGFWKLRELREARQLRPRDMLPPGLYRNVAVLIADLCSFSSYVRDTADGRIVRESLTSFYSKARYQIINSGGMLYQFVGDEVIGFFGLPDREADAVQTAFETAQALISIGNSVSHHWQRQIDRVQNSGGVHVGLAIGDLQIVSLRPFGRTHVGAIGDCINVAARLMSTAGPGEVAASNSFLQSLDEETQGQFQEVEPVEARNVGRIKAWKWASGQGV